MSEEKNLEIRSSTAEFLIFEEQSKEDNIEVCYEDETLWMTQKMMSALFDVSVKTISEHLVNIFNSGELEQNSTVQKMHRSVQNVQ